jgi:hypothetical protein
LTSASAASTYLPLSGGTLTGTLTVNGANGVRVFVDGGASITSHLYFANAANNRAYNWQLDESSNAAMWGYGGSAWAKLLTVSSAGALNTVGAITQNGSQVLTAANYSSYALPLSGGTLSGVLTLVSGGTAINISGQSDSFGYNATAGQGTYIKGTGATYIYGGGKFFDGATVQTLLHAGNYTSYAATANHNHTYDVNNAWLRDANDDANVKLYGNTRQMVFRTDGTTEFASGVGGYAFAWMYGGDSASERRMLLASDGRLWTNYHGWLDTMSVAYASTAGSADAIDGVGFRNTGSNSGTNADNIESNGITYYVAGVTNFSGNSTDGALYSQAYSGNWQHQIAGDYRSGQIALRGKNNGTWQSWRTVLDSSNYSSYALPLSGGTLSGTLRFGDSTNGIYLSGGRLNIRSESTDNVAEYASYGLYLPKTGQTAGLYVQSPIEARGGLRIGSGAENGTITVGADTSATANRLVQRDASGHITGNYILGSYFNSSAGNSENPTIGQVWTQSTGDNYLRKSTPAHFISQLGLLTTGNYNSYSPTLTGGNASGTWSINVTGSSGSAGFSTYNQILDTRAGQYTPNAYQDHRTTYEFTNQIVGGGDWHAAMTMQGWHDAYAAWQIIGPASTGAHENWYLRSGVNTSWNPLRNILHSGNFGSYALPLSGGTISGNGTLDFGPNSTWGATLRVGGNGHGGGSRASVVTTNGNLHLDASNNNGIYLGWYNSGNNGVYFGNGASGQVGRVDGGGNASFNGSITSGGNTVLHAGNYTSYAVPQSSVSESGGGSVILKTASNGYLYINSWIHTGGGGLFSGTNSAHFYPNDQDYGSWRISGTRNGWYGIWFDSGSTLMMNSSEVGFHRSGSGWQMRWQTGTGYVHKGSSGGGTAAVILDSSNYTSYAFPAASGGTISDLRTNFSSGGGGHNFGANHYSMGKDIANGSWSHPHYADLIIGYHTGIRLGGAYSGIRFYNNSPTTDANNDGNGDSGEALLMTVGGYVGNTGQDVNVNNTIYAASYRGNANVGGTGQATHHPAGIYSQSTNWLYGTIYTNGNGIEASGATCTLTATRANRANGWFYIDDNHGVGVVGAYSSYRYQTVYAMGDSYKMSADGTSLSNMYGIAWSHPNAGGAAGNLTDHGLLIINAGGFRCAISNSIVASANITAYSDERLKTNWQPMPEDYVTRLAKVKVGIYDRTDQENITQVGVSAQSFQQLLPQAIMTAKDEMQTLSVSYGNAALASSVELAKEVVDLRTRVAQLEFLINQLIGD